MKPLFLLLAVAACASAAIPEPVRIDTGMVTGATTTSTEVRVFKGIPFAAPPVGDLRWRAPQPAPHWDGVRAAVISGARLEPECGRTYREIAARLNQSAVPTKQGGRWHASTVHAILRNTLHQSAA
jgi:para-nitrobenzyl esterase